MCYSSCYICRKCIQSKQKHVRCCSCSNINTNQWQGSSQAAPNYTLAVTLITLFVSAPLVVFPWTMMSKKGLTAIRNFFLRPRTTVILTCFMTIGWFAAMISMTVHSTNASNCALDDALKKDPHYVQAWSKQVT